MRYHSYLNSAKKIIESNWGEVPFAVFLKKYFAANKKYGGKDRKQIAALCYNFYRLGKAIPDMPVSEKLIAATFLCEHSHSEFLQFHKPEWNDMISRPIAVKMKILGLTIDQIFPWADELSTVIDLQPYCHSFFTQPDLFLRSRPGKQKLVIKKLEEAGLKFEMLHEDCIALPNGTKVDVILEIDKEVVIQDHNSQQVLNFIKEQGTRNKEQDTRDKEQDTSIQLPVSSIQHQVSSIPVRPGHPGGQHPVSIWDCCAASGGKSILAYDILNGEIELTVSDIRESILLNLKKRFETAGIKNYKSFVVDLSKGNTKLPAGKTEIIICDVPCTGSGTWSRTPEQLFFFKKKTIEVYVEMQEKIVRHVIPQLKKGGIFIYITCSVFKKENEELVNFIKEKFHLQLLQMELLKGYDKKGDSMFTAVFKRS